MSTTFDKKVKAAQDIEPGDVITMDTGRYRMARDVGVGDDGWTSILIGETWMSLRSTHPVAVVGHADKPDPGAVDLKSPLPRAAYPAGEFNQPDEVEATTPNTTLVQFKRTNEACAVPAMQMLPPHSCLHPTRRHLEDGKRVMRPVLKRYGIRDHPDPALREDYHTMSDKQLDPHGKQWWNLKCSRCRAELLMKGRWELEDVTNSYGVTYTEFVHDRDGRYGRRHYGRIVDDKQAICAVTPKQVRYFSFHDDEHGNKVAVEHTRDMVVVIIGEHLGTEYKTWKDAETGEIRRSRYATKLIEAEAIIEVADVEQGVILVNDLTRDWALEGHRTQGGLPSWDEPSISESPDWDPSVLRLMASEHSAPADEYEDRQVLPT